MQKKLALLAFLVILFIFIGMMILDDLVVSMKYPVQGKITSGFGNRTHPVTGEEGKFHNGIDIASPTGTPIKAPAPGTVTKRYYNEIGGNSIVIKHDNGYTTGYAHLNTFSVSIGDKVKTGQIIGTVGATGRVTGAHLHLTMRDPKGEYVDPAKVLARSYS